MISLILPEDSEPEEEKGQEKSENAVEEETLEVLKTIERERKQMKRLIDSDSEVEMIPEEPEPREEVGFKARKAAFLDSSEDETKEEGKEPSVQEVVKKKFSAIIDSDSSSGEEKSVAKKGSKSPVDGILGGVSSIHSFSGRNQV